jgi:hypothetical protein
MGSAGTFGDIDDKKWQRLPKAIIPPFVKFVLYVLYEFSTIVYYYYLKKDGFHRRNIYVYFPFRKLSAETLEN